MLDPTGIAPNGLALSGAALTIISLMDGRHRCVDIQAEFMRRHGTLLFSDDLRRILSQLDEALFLEGPRFSAHVAELTRQYRDAPVRPLRDKDSLGAPVDRLGEYLDQMLAKPPGAGPASNGRLLGIVAPHLDYARGGPCYGAAYRDLAKRTQAERFVIIGTNHFGLSHGPVGTGKDFETPFGVVPCDAAFVQRLSDRCGADLREMEVDHAREHSVELQAVLLKHVLAERAFSIVPFLCSDPCGSKDGPPPDGQAADLKRFAEALRAELESDGVPACIVAAADLSHVGRFFQDDRELDADQLHAVEASDRRAVEQLMEQGPEAFRRLLSQTENPTHICSAGCLYVLATVLEGRARPRLLHYHQAVTQEAENCVTCCAVEYVA